MGNKAKTKKTVHVEVELRDGDTTEKLIKRFIRKCRKSGVVEILREKSYYKKPSELRQEKKRQREWAIYLAKLEEEKNK